MVILFFGLVKMEQKRRNEVKLKGVETVGIVIHKSISRDNQGGAMNFNIKFEFAHNGKRFVVSTTPIFNSRSDYDNAIIGMQYKVKYLPNAPRKAIIFLDQPIE